MGIFALAGILINLYPSFSPIDFIIIEKWQTSYLAIYAIWLGIVAFIFPIIFGYN